MRITLALALALVAAPAEARPGLPLAASVEVARKAKVPLAVFVVRSGRVVVEEWHSYTTPTQETGPAWSVAQAHALRATLMGAAKPQHEMERRVPWASFPVWAFAYGGDRWAVYESKRGTDRVWGILAVASWYWTDALAVTFAMPEDTHGWKLLGGKLLELTHTQPPPSQAPRSRRSASPGFPSAF
ncbi:MAG: hypothetical protein JWM80_5904 [Cyanobacteria bacterium RYN_339]|nr:hypothetical protein [Cyanobacteria bacterium RYN_339]